MSIQTAPEPQFANLSRQMGKMMDQLQRGFFSFCPAETWTPAVNLYECDAAYFVCVDLSGVEKERIELVVTDNQLKLRGHRTAPQAPGSDDPAKLGRVRIHLMEIDHGPFCREVDLPNDVAHDRIEATYISGMLWVELPKRT